MAILAPDDIDQLRQRKHCSALYERVQDQLRKMWLAKAENKFWLMTAGQFYNLPVGAQLFRSNTPLYPVDLHKNRDDEQLAEQISRQMELQLAELFRGMRREALQLEWDDDVITPAVVSTIVISDLPKLYLERRAFLLDWFIQVDYLTLARKELK